MGCATSKVEALAGAPIEAVGTPMLYCTMPGESLPASHVLCQQEAHAGGVPPAPLISSQPETDSTPTQAAGSAASTGDQLPSEQSSGRDLAVELAVSCIPALAELAAEVPASRVGERATIREVHLQTVFAPCGVCTSEILIE